jgi:hypothetical protein
VCTLTCLMQTGGGVVQVFPLATALFEHSSSGTLVVVASMTDVCVRVLVCSGVLI